MEKRILTPEIAALMVGMSPVSRTVGVPFTPDFYLKDERLKPFAPVFWQRGWTEDEKNTVMQLLAERREKSGGEAEIMAATRSTVIRFENLFDLGTREEISVTKDGAADCISQDQFDSFPVHVKSALLLNAMKITGLSGLSAVEKEGLE